jgi:hypothetical protein
MALAYLLGISYFAFRPFESIPGLRHEATPFEWLDGAVHIRTGAALEEREKTAAVRLALMKSGSMSLEAVVQTDSLPQSGPARIISYSCNPYYRNFTLGQEGAALEFRLRTSETDPNGLYPCLVVPNVFVPNRMQHLVVVYDGAKTKCYVDGVLRPEQVDLQGDFSGWGRGQILMVGDEPAGDRPWNGLIRRFSIYDRALTPLEVVGLEKEQAVPGAVLVRDFKSTTPSAPYRLGGMKRLHYRNLFIATEPFAFQLTDCLFNIIAFMPLGFFAYLLLPVRNERRQMIADIAVPIMLGLFVSGGIEWCQRSIFERSPSALDLVYNVAGSLLGSLLARLVFSAKNKTMNWRNK